MYSEPQDSTVLSIFTFSCPSDYSDSKQPVATCTECVVCQHTCEPHKLFNYPVGLYQQSFRQNNMSGICNVAKQENTEIFYVHL